MDINDSAPDSDKESVGRSSVDSEGDVISRAPSKEDVERDSEYVEPLLLCEFCDERYAATELLKHVAYSDDERHGSSGKVPMGFHPATAPVIEEGTIQVAFPDELRTNVHFHPVCRSCGKKFYHIDKYLEHMDGDQGSFDDHHRTDKQPRIPLLVPFNRDGTIIPTIPPLTELTEEPAVENISDDEITPRPDVLVELDRSDTNANTELHSPSKIMNEKEPYEVEEEIEGNRTTVTNDSHKAGIENDSLKMENEDRSNNSPSEISNKEEMKIDSVLLALVDLVVEKETTDYDSRVDLLDAALEEFLGSVITDDQIDFKSQTTTSRRFEVETDPVLRCLLQETVENNDVFDSYNELIQHALFESIGIDSSMSKIRIPNYNRYAFVIERLIQNDDTPYDSPASIVHTALENHLQI